MRTLLFPVCTLLALLWCGCAVERLPSEDIEILQLYKEEISVLKNPRLPRNGKEKYQAIRSLIRKVDFTFTRETATLDKLLYHGDAVVEDYGGGQRVITFSYEYQNRVIRLRFQTERMFVLRVDVFEK